MCFWELSPSHWRHLQTTRNFDLLMCVQNLQYLCTMVVQTTLTSNTMNSEMKIGCHWRIYFLDGKRLNAQPNLKGRPPPPNVTSFCTLYLLMCVQNLQYLCTMVLQTTLTSNTMNSEMKIGCHWWIYFLDGKHDWMHNQTLKDVHLLQVWPASVRWLLQNLLSVDL